MLLYIKHMKGIIILLIVCPFLTNSFWQPGVNSYRIDKLYSKWLLLCRRYINYVLPSCPTSYKERSQRMTTRQDLSWDLFWPPCLQFERFTYCTVDYFYCLVQYQSWFDWIFHLSSWFWIECWPYLCVWKAINISSKVTVVQVMKGTLTKLNVLRYSITLILFHCCIYH